LGFLFIDHLLHETLMGNHLATLVFQPPPSSLSLNPHVDPSSLVGPKNHPFIWLRTQSNRTIPAIFIKQPSAQVTLLFSHGNAEDLSSIYDWFVVFSIELNVNLMIYDYEGYGAASLSGHVIPTEQGCYDDIDAVYEYMIEKLQLLPESIVLYGRSLGSGPSVYLAEKLSTKGVRLGGLILQVSCFFFVCFRTS
jgi:hypothetical protein